MPTAAVSGTATATINETDIVTGGKTIIVTLTGDTFVPAAAAEILLVGRQKGSFAGTTTNQDVNFALTGGLASVPAAGDLVFVTFAIGHVGRTHNMLIADTTGADYVYPLASVLNADDSFDTRLHAGYKFMGGTPDTAVRFVSGSGNSQDAGTYDIVVLRGVDPTTPMDATPTTATGTNGHAANPPAITPATQGAWTYHAGASAAQTGAEHTSSDLLDFLSSTQADTNDSNLGAGFLSKGWTSGAQNPAAFGGGGGGTLADSWAAFSVAFRPEATTPFADARQDIIDGLDSAQSEANGWDAKVKGLQGVSGVVRTSDTVVTITLDAQAAYSITAMETITVTVPASALAGGEAIVATPTFTVSNSVTHEGAAALALALSLATAGQRTQNAARTGSLSLSLALAGQRTQHGAAALAHALTLATAGEKTLTGSAALALALTLVTDGDVTTPVQEGEAALALSLALAADGQRTQHGSSALSLTLAVLAAASAERPGATALSLALTLATSGQRTQNTASTVALALTLAAVGDTALFGAASLPLALSILAAGQHTQSGQATVALALTLAAAASRELDAAVAMPLTAALDALGGITQNGAAALSLVATLVTTGVILVFHTAADRPPAGQGRLRQVPQAGSGAFPIRPGAGIATGGREF